MILGRNLSGSSLNDIKYPWALALYEQAVANTWFPMEVPLGDDIADWRRMDKAEKEALKFLMAFFNPNELYVNKAIAFGVYPYVFPAECQLYLSKQVWEEANHCMAFKYVLDTFGIVPSVLYDPGEISSAKLAKQRFEEYYIEQMAQQELDITFVEDQKRFVRNLVAFNVILEGIWFYSGFMVALSFRQRNLLKNFGSMIDWIVRDESLHLKFGINLLLTILDEYPLLQDVEFANEIEEMILDGVQLEVEYNKELFQNPVLGLSADYVNQYVKYIADRRLEELGFAPHFNVTNPAQWMATANDTLQLVNFFEQTNTSYEVNR